MTKEKMEMSVRLSMDIDKLEDSIFKLKHSLNHFEKKGDNLKLLSKYIEIGDRKSISEFIVSHSSFKINTNDSSNDRLSNNIKLIISMSVAAIIKQLEDELIILKEEFDKL